MVSPSEWGPNAWELLHGIAERIGYQKNASLIKDEQNCIRLTLRHFWSLLPCQKCQTHYKEWYRMHPLNTTKYGEYLQEDLREWLFNLHENVNHDREVISGIPIDMLKEKYKSINLRECANRLKTMYQRGIQTGVLKPIDWKVAWKQLDMLLLSIGC